MSERARAMPILKFPVQFFSPVPSFPGRHGVGAGDLKRGVTAVDTEAPTLANGSRWLGCLSGKYPGWSRGVEAGFPTRGSQGSFSFFTIWGTTAGCHVNRGPEMVARSWTFARSG